jgi:hypothetical protein
MQRSNNFDLLIRYAETEAKSLVTSYTCFTRAEFFANWSNSLTFHSDVVYTNWPFSAVHGSHRGQCCNAGNGGAYK